MGIFDFFQSDLCNEKQLQVIGDKFSDRLLLHSVNSAYAMGLILEYFFSIHSASEPHDSFFKKLHQSLCYGHLDRYDLEQFKVQTPETKITLPSKFLYYYIEVLPLIIRGTTYQKKPFSDKEYSFLVKCCFDKIHCSGYNYGFNLCTLQYFNYFSGYEVLVKKTIKDDSERLKYINNYDIFFTGNKLEEEIMVHPKHLSRNGYYLFKKLLDDYFLLFYSSLHDYMGELVFYYKALNLTEKIK